VRIRTIVGWLSVMLLMCSVGFAAVQMAWPAYLAAALGFAAVALFLFWAPIARRVLGGIGDHMEFSVTELLIDATNQKITIRFKVRNNQARRASVEALISGSAILDNVFTLDGMVLSGASHVDLPGYRDVILSVRLPLPEPWLGELIEKRRDGREAQWEIETAWDVSSRWGDATWEPPATSFSEVPRIHQAGHELLGPDE
jgi:hypothetical protein